MSFQYQNPLHTSECKATCRNHHFAGNEQEQYDSLKWRGRRSYDLLRYLMGATHEQAFAGALAAFGKREPLPTLGEGDVFVPEEWVE